MDARVRRCFSLNGDLTGGTGETMSPVARDDSDLAALMATSGSTGVPRFLRITHGNLIANTEAIIRSQHLRDEERAMLILPLSYCFGASVFHTHLYQGGGVVFDRRFMFPDKVLQAINEHGCTDLCRGADGLSRVVASVREVAGQQRCQVCQGGCYRRAARWRRI